jgi:hypothetical protein
MNGKRLSTNASTLFPQLVPYPMTPSAVKTSTAAKTVVYDCLIDTNIILRADQFPSRFTTRPQSDEGPFRQGQRLCVAKQTLIESWVVATRPRDANGFGYSARFAAEGISKVKRLFYLLAETDDIYPAWEKLVPIQQGARRPTTTRGSSPRCRFTTSAESSDSMLTILSGIGIQVLHPDEVLA